MGEKVVIFGTGDFAAVAAIYLMEDSPHEVVAFTVHRQFVTAPEFQGKPVVPFEDLEANYPPDRYAMLVAMGFKGLNKARAEVYQACKARGYAVSVVVVDRGGLTVVSLRADGASPHTIENARRKAYTAMTFKMTTAEFIKRMATEPVRREQTTLPNVIAIDGGVPIKAGNEVVGGIGMSGSPGVDGECVMAGMDKAKDLLQ